MLEVDCGVTVGIAVSATSVAVTIIGVIEPNTRDGDESQNTNVIFFGGSLSAYARSSRYNN